MPGDIPADTVVSWHVRADDGQATSAWSDEGDGSVCSSVYDDENPADATISSPEYPTPDEEFWADGVGVYGHFTMHSPSDDVVSYTYGFLGGPYGTVSADQPGAAVTIPYLPLTAGPKSLTVRAIDRAGRSSGQSEYDFNVQSGRAPVARWKLDDPAGSRSAAATSGTAARAGTGVTFGAPAPAGTTAAATADLDGSGHGFLTTDAPATDIRKSFAVSAWVRPAETSRTMTVASQDAEGKPGGPGISLRVASSTRRSPSAWDCRSSSRSGRNCGRCGGGPTGPTGSGAVRSPTRGEHVRSSLSPLVRTLCPPDSRRVPRGPRSCASSRAGKR